MPKHIIIPIESKHGRFEVIIDEADASLVLPHRWSVDVHGDWRKLVYARSWIRQPDGTRKRVLLHHLIMDDCPPGMEVDHINRNPLDNRRENLRYVTHQENMRNATPKYAPIKSPEPLSIYHGVTPVKHMNLYRAHITVNGRKRNLGTFRSEEGAARAYDAAARTIYGQDAQTNFP